VVVADVSDDGASETVVAVENKGRKALFVHTDVSDAAAVDALMQKAADAFGRLDILVTAAGFVAEGNRHQPDGDVHRRSIGVPSSCGNRPVRRVKDTGIQPGSQFPKRAGR